MSLMQRAFLVKKDGFVMSVVTDKNIIKGVKGLDFEDVTLHLTKNDINQWNEVFNIDQDEDDNEDY